MAGSKQSTARHWLVFVGCCVITFVTLGMFENTTGIFISAVSEAIGVGRGNFGLYLTIQNIGFMIVLTFAGRVLQKVKRFRLLMTVSAILSCTAFTAMSFYNVYWQWIASGLVVGISIGFCGFMSVAVLINNWFDKYQGTLVGLAMAIGSLAAIVWNPIAGWIIEFVSWRTAYLAMGIFAFATLVPTAAFIIRFKPSDVGLKPFGYKEAQTEVTEPSGESKGVTSKAAFKTPVYYLLFLFAMTATFLSSFNINMPGYVDSLGYSVTFSATMASVVLAGAFVGKPLLGLLYDKLGCVKATGFSSLYGLIGIIILINAGHNPPIFIVGCVFFGLAFAMSTVSPPNAARLIFGMKDYSTIYSTIVIGTMGAGAIGMPLYGFIYDVAGSYIPGLYFVFVVTILGFLSMVFATRLGKKLPGSPLMDKALKDKKPSVDKAIKDER